MSAVVPSIIGTGAEAVGAVAPVVVGAGEGLTAAQIAGGVAGLGLGAAALGGGGGGAAAAAPVVTGGGAVAPVTTTPVTTTPVAPVTTTSVPTTTTTPVATTGGAVSPTTTTGATTGGTTGAPVGPGTVSGAGAPGTVAPEIPPGNVPVTDVGTSAAGQTPLSPVQTEVIAPGTSSVAPAEAQVLNPTDGLPPVEDRYVPPSDGGFVGAGGWGSDLGLADLGLLAGGTYLGGKVLEKLLTPPPVIKMPSYGPIGPTTWGTAKPVVNPGMNPGYLSNPNVVHPQLQGQGTQTNYYWGARPLIQNPADINQWNTAIPAEARAWGATSAQGVGANRMNLNSLINETLGMNQARSAYPYAIASPVAPTNYAKTASVNGLVNATLAAGQQASGLAPVAPRV